MVRPPSTTSVVPVTKDALSPERNNAASATSAGKPAATHGVKRRGRGVKGRRVW